MHYQCLMPQNFVPPLLHLEFRMVNQVWDEVEWWTDEHVEIIPSEEKEARKGLKSAIENRDRAKVEKHESEKTVEIELREKNGEIKALKAALWRKDIGKDERQQVNIRVTLLQTFIDEQTELLKSFKVQLKTSEDMVSECKKNVPSRQMRKARIIFAFWYRIIIGET